MKSSEAPCPPASSDAFIVACLCAEWCGTCREYHEDFVRLQEEFPRVRFLWRDIEEHAESLGDLDIENFPTILVRRGSWVLFFGTMLPQVGLLRRLIETFMDQSPEESRTYAFATPERRGWNEDLAGIGLD